MIDPTFNNVDKLFVQSFRTGENDPIRNSFDKYYMALVEIKDFNALIDIKQFFYQHVKSKQEVSEKGLLQIWNKSKIKSYCNQIVSQKLM